MNRITVTDERRKEQLLYTGVTEEKLKVIAENAERFFPFLNEMIEILYEKIYKVQHLRSIIDQYTTIDELQKTQRIYLEEVFNAKIDDRYIRNRYQVGKVHWRIGLGLQWYIATYSILNEIISSIAVREFSNPETLYPLMDAISAVFNFDIQITLEAYNQVELDRAVHPIKYELNKLGQLSGFSEQDLDCLDEFSGFITFQVSKIVDEFLGILQERLKDHLNLTPFFIVNQDISKRIEKLLLQFFQEKVFLDTEFFFRVLRDWSVLIIENHLPYQYVPIYGDTLVEATKNVFLNPYTNCDRKMYQYISSFDRMIKFSITIIEEIIKPYIVLRDLQFMDIYAYEISSIDFGRITWLNPKMEEHFFSQQDLACRNNLIGKRCYEVIHGRNFPCIECPILKGIKESNMYFVDETNKQKFYKVRHMPKNEILGLSRALLIIQDITQEGKIMFDTIERLLHLAEFRDDDTGSHVYRIGILSEKLATLAGCDSEFVKNISIAAQFHDIGKVGIPDSILNKPAKLSPEERKSMQTHAQIGYQILSNLNLPVIQMAATIAQSHHEWWNGEGYPNGLKGEEIPLAGRIVAIVDVFDALLSKRVYKESFPPEMVKNIFLEGKGKQFDPKLVELFINMWEEFVELRFFHLNSATRN